MKTLKGFLFLTVFASTLVSQSSTAQDLQASFDEALKKFDKKMDVKGFEATYGVKFEAKINFDPTQVKYFDRLRNLQDKGVNLTLNKDEKDAFKRNGFVVSERLGDSNFIDVFSKIYKSDIPVYISADAILHAWHKSYDNVLATVEEKTFYGELQEILKDLHKDLSQRKPSGDSAEKAALEAMDMHLTVALSLLQNTETYDLDGHPLRMHKTAFATTSAKDIRRIVRGIVANQGLKFLWLGDSQNIEPNTYKPRGHYSDGGKLAAYFRTITWLSKIDAKLDLAKPDKTNFLYALRMTDLVKSSKSWEKLSHFRSAIEALVGPTESLTPEKMVKIFPDAEPKSLGSNRIPYAAGKLKASGIRPPLIRSESKVGVIDDKTLVFSLWGGMFTHESWLQTVVTYPAIRSVSNPKAFVPRYETHFLDVAFGSFGNNAATSYLAEMMRTGKDKKYPYLNNLISARTAIADDKKRIPTSVASSWIEALGLLSTPKSWPKNYPQAMRTKAWGARMLNTQAASWTQLRHDNVLYNSSSASGGIACEYPTGFVEPIPEFWSQLMQMVSTFKQSVQSFPTKGTQGVVNYLEHFQTVMAKLKTIAEKQEKSLKLSAEETKWIDNLLITRSVPDGCTSIDIFSGWYPTLFYNEDWTQGMTNEKNKAAEAPEPLVADIHTIKPSLQPVPHPGAVLHEAVGTIDMMVIAIDNGPDRLLYAGPVISHYEFSKPYPTRLDDDEWKEEILYRDKDKGLFPRPAWTKDYLVRGFWWGN